MSEKPLAIVVILFGCVVGYFAVSMPDLDSVAILMIPAVGLILTGVYLFVRK